MKWRGRVVTGLLASSSLAALMIGSGAPPAFAACITTAPFSNAGIATCIQLNNTSFTGNITNTGTLTGTVTGAISLTAGTLMGQIADSGVISSGGIKIDHASTITATGTAISISGTFLGGITNSGTISAGTAGIFVESVSTFLGGISNSGTISASRAGVAVASVAVFGSASAGGGISNSGTISVGDHGVGIDVLRDATLFGGITNSGTISAGAFGAGIVLGVTTFFGDVSNSGKIAAPTGIFICGCATFAGGAIVNSGTIMGSTAAIDASAATSPVTIDQTGGLIAGAINLSPNADVLTISGGTIAGNVIGHGTSDTVSFALGSGTFTYASPFAMTGLSQVNFNSGTAFIDGSIAATTINVNNGGTAAGTGMLSGPVTVMSGGTLMPGQPLGTLTISGSLAFNPGSFYAVHVTPTGTNSQTAVTGAATIAGGTVVVAPQFGHYNATTYTIVTATGGRSGMFAGLAFAGQLAFSGSASLSYDPNDAFLNLDPGYVILAAPTGANANQQNVINGINTAILAGNTVAPGFQSLGNLPTPAFLNALTQLSGEVGASFSQGAFQAGSSFLNLMLNPFVDNRGGDGGSGGPIGYAPERPAPAGGQASAAFASINKAPPRDATLGSTQRFQAWGAAYGGTGTVSGDPAAGSHNTNAQVYGFGGGVDARVSPDTIVGFALAGGGTTWGLDQGLGNGRSDMFQAGVYGTTHFGAAYLSGALAWSFHDVTTNRTVTVAGTDMLQANFRANVLSERVEGGYRVASPVASPWLAITPYAAVQVQSLFLPSYGEGATSGSSQFALSYAAQTTTTERTELGARLDKSWLDTGWFAEAGGLLTLYGRAAWAHDFNNTATATALFQSLPGSNFVVNGAKPAPDGALLTAGAQYRLTNGWSLQAKFDGEFSSTTRIYSGTGVIRKEW